MKSEWEAMVEGQSQVSINISLEYVHEVSFKLLISFCLDLTVKSIDPNDPIAVEAMLELSTKRRATGCTGMNATSSRSHSVFTLNMTARHEEMNQTLSGSLNLVDLAGSERLAPDAIGQRAEETNSINKSLSSLTDVSTAIGQNDSYVPFCNSKLTYLLQPTLSGDGMACMSEYIVNT